MAPLFGVSSELFSVTETIIKIIASTRDLAINGAPPAFAKPLHVGRPHLGSKAQFLELAEQIYDSRWLTNDGPTVQEFEAAVAKLHSVKHCVATCSGTAALDIAIRALDLQGEVILPSYTFVATAHALKWQNITPVFADIDPKTHNLNVDSVRARVSSKTTGIIAVHLWGRVAPVDELKAVADELSLKLMYDAAHAFGCSYHHRMVGNFGDCEIVSFHATKVVNSFEGGALLTNNDELAKKARLMRNFGFAGFDNVVALGTNGKMTEICAAMGLVNLRAFSDITSVNRRNYDSYRKYLGEIPELTCIDYQDCHKANYHYIVVEVSSACSLDRDKIVSMLHAENVLARRYFWPGCHGMAPYRNLYPEAGESLPNTRDVAERVLVLPTGEAATEADIKAICNMMKVYIEAGEQLMLESGSY